MQCTLTWSVSFVLLAWTVSAHAAPPSLNGNYAFTGTAACLFAPGSSTSPSSPGNTTPNTDSNFDTALQPLNPSKSFSNSFAVEGIRTFNGDGTGSVQAIEVALTVPPTPGVPPPPATPTFPHFPPSASSSTFSYQFTYTFNPDGSFTSSVVPSRRASARIILIGPTIRAPPMES